MDASLQKSPTVGCRVVHAQRPGASYVFRQWIVRHSPRGRRRFALCYRNGRAKQIAERFVRVVID